MPKIVALEWWCLAIPGTLMAAAVVWLWVLTQEARERTAAATQACAEVRGHYEECRTVVGICGDALVSCQGWQARVGASLDKIEIKTAAMIRQCEGL